MPRWPDLIVSTATSLCFIRNRKVDVIETYRALYYGITWNSEEMFVGCGFNDGAGLIAVFDHNLKPKREFSVAAQDFHQLLWRNGKLYVALTQDNALGTIDMTSGEVTRVYHSGGKIIDGLAEDHINSVWTDPDGSIWLCMHRQSTKFNRPSRIQKLDQRFKVQQQINVGKNIHNVFRNGMHLFICDSSNWRLLVLNANTGAIRRVVGLGGFTRGLARFKGGYVVGISKDAPREQRKSGSSRVALLNNRLKIIDEIILKDCGGVQDLRIVGSKMDLAHNGISFMVEPCPQSSG